eukprot:395563-Amphidinium_carterae.1
MCGETLTVPYLALQGLCGCNTCLLRLRIRELSGLGPSAWCRNGLVKLDGSQASDCHWYEGSQCGVLSGGGVTATVASFAHECQRETRHFCLQLSV